MTSRRTLNEALQVSKLSEAARAFVSGDSSQPAPAQVMPAPAVDDDPPNDSTVVPVQQEPSPRPEPAAKPPLPAPDGGVVSMTFRLPTNIAAALLRASLHRKLDKQTPFTQQEIVAVALTAWLQKGDYLPGNGPQERNED